MQHKQRPSDLTSDRTRWQSAAFFAVRYGIAGAMILAGVVVLLAVGGDLGAYGFASAVGAGLSVLLLNLLYRMSVSGDRDREREEEARKYFDEHGIWADDEEAPERVRERRWTLPRAAVTAEQEARDEGDAHRLGGVERDGPPKPEPEVAAARLTTLRLITVAEAVRHVEAGTRNGWPRMGDRARALVPPREGQSREPRPRACPEAARSG